MKSYLSLFFSFFFLSLEAVSQAQYPEKILICGIARNVAPMVDNTVRNIESLGSNFIDYAVIIYENNSDDKTTELFKKWATKNPHVTFLSENIPAKKLRPSRTERLAEARNVILDKAREPQYQDFKYLIMADLDFMSPWPIQEILTTINTAGDWDCVAANGVAPGGHCYDTYALRYDFFPLGPEIMGNAWYTHRFERDMRFEAEYWQPVYSAFGGLAIYKTSSLFPFSYSGIVTEELRAYYKAILCSLPQDHEYINRYLDLIGIARLSQRSKIPILFRINNHGEHSDDYPAVTCCEHVPLHASMAVHGFGKIYINPKMRMYYYY